MGPRAGASLRGAGRFLVLQRHVGRRSCGQFSPSCGTSADHGAGSTPGSKAFRASSCPSSGTESGVRGVSGTSPAADRAAAMGSGRLSHLIQCQVQSRCSNISSRESPGTTASSSTGSRTSGRAGTSTGTRGITGCRDRGSSVVNRLARSGTSQLWSLGRTDVYSRATDKAGVN